MKILYAIGYPTIKINKRFRNELDNHEIFKDLVTEFMTVKK